jgi:hypothetical protein
MKPKLYVVVMVTTTNTDVNVTVMGVSQDPSVAERLAEHQRKYIAPIQVIDVFETEEIQQ